MGSVIKQAEKGVSSEVKNDGQLQTGFVKKGMYHIGVGVNVNYVYEWHWILRLYDFLLGPLDL